MTEEQTAVITKRKVSKKIANLGTIAYDNLSLNALIDALKKLRKEKIKIGFTDFMIEEGDKETDGCTYTIYGTRLETDGEYKKRIKTDQDIIL